MTVLWRLRNGAGRVDGMRDTSDPAPADVGQTWPTGALPPGSRVTVIRASDWDGPWQAEFPGTIDAAHAPEPNEHAQALSGELLYWVTFDTPQHDSDGDGPYRKAQIWGRYLRTESDTEV